MSERTIKALKESLAPTGSKLVDKANDEDSIGSMQMDSSLPRTESHATRNAPFNECKQKARDLLESSAMSAGMCIGANGHVISSAELAECQAAMPKSFLRANAKHDLRQARGSAKEDGNSSVGVHPHATVWGTGGSGQNFLAAKFAARFRQKVFKKLDCVIVAGTNPSSYECVQGGAKLLRKAANIVDNIKKTKERKDRDNPDRDFAEFVQDKVYFQDTPWCPTFDVQYLNGGGPAVDIGLDTSQSVLSTNQRKGSHSTPQTPRTPHYSRMNTSQSQSRHSSSTTG